MSLGTDVVKLIVRHEPQAMAADPAAVGRTVGQIATALGCLLAPVRHKVGQAAFEDILQQIINQTVKAAKEIEAAAHELAKTNGGG